MQSGLKVSTGLRAVVSVNNNWAQKKRYPSLQQVANRLHGALWPPATICRMQTFLVGGAVRDALLGIPDADRDWVVVGSTPEAMVAAGFTPVGKDFPVFVLPHTREEHALARTERKTSPGY